MQALAGVGKQPPKLATCGDARSLEEGGWLMIRARRMPADATTTRAIATEASRAISSPRADRSSYRSRKGGIRMSWRSANGARLLAGCHLAGVSDLTAANRSNLRSLDGRNCSRTPVQGRELDLEGRAVPVHMNNRSVIANL